MYIPISWWQNTDGRRTDQYSVVVGSLQAFDDQAKRSLTWPYSRPRPILLDATDSETERYIGTVRYTASVEESDSSVTVSATIAIALALCVPFTRPQRRLC